MAQPSNSCWPVPASTRATLPCACPLAAPLPRRCPCSTSTFSPDPTATGCAVSARTRRRSCWRGTGDGRASTRWWQRRRQTWSACKSSCRLNSSRPSSGPRRPLHRRRRQQRRRRQLRQLHSAKLTWRARLQRKQHGRRHDRATEPVPKAVPRRMMLVLQPALPLRLQLSLLPQQLQRQPLPPLLRLLSSRLHLPTPQRPHPLRPQRQLQPQTEALQLQPRPRTTTTSAKTTVTTK